jgi:hypothetical protein
LGLVSHLLIFLYIWIRHIRVQAPVSTRVKDVSLNEVDDHFFGGHMDEERKTEPKESQSSNQNLEHRENKSGEVVRDDLFLTRLSVSSSSYRSFAFYDDPQILQKVIGQSEIAKMEDVLIRVERGVANAILKGLHLLWMVILLFD